MPDNLQAAIDVVVAASAAEAAAPAPSTEVAPASTPAATEAALATETPAPAATPETPAAPVDETAELFAALEKRKAERAAKQATVSPTAALEAKLAALEAKLAAQPTTAPGDLGSLVRQHGAVEALRLSGLDPLEFYEQIRTQARDPDAVRRKAAAQAETDRLAKIEQQLEGIGKSKEQERAEAQARADHDAWTTYVGMVAKPETGTPLLAKLPADERIEQTNKTISWLEKNGHDLDSIDDVSLAKITESRMRQLRDLLAGTDASVTETRVPATTDGAAKTTKSHAATTTLSNDLASQSTGRTVPMTEEQRLRAAIDVMEKMQSA